MKLTWGGKTVGAGRTITRLPDAVATTLYFLTGVPFRDWKVEPFAKTFEAKGFKLTINNEGDK